MMDNLLQQKRNPDRAQLETSDDSQELMGKSMAPPAFSVTASGSGQDDPSDQLKSEMGQSMGSDFSSVQFKTESSKATELGAKAFAQGNEVHFAPGQFNPHSTEGKSLVGHELAHVVQQRQGRVQPTTQAGGEKINDQFSLESEADQWGAKAARGESVSQLKTAASAPNGQAPVQRKAFSRLNKNEKKEAQAVLKDFQQEYGKLVPKTNSKRQPKAVIPPDTFVSGNHTYFLEDRTTQTTRNTTILTFVYKGENGLRYTFTKHNNSKVKLGDISKARDGGANLKTSRPDNMAYYWKGDEDAGISFGMNPQYRLDDNADVPNGFEPTHLPQAKGIQYFKQVEKGRARKAAPNHQQLMDSGYGMRTQEKKHKGGKDNHGNANTVMGCSATQYAGHLSNVAQQKDQINQNMANDINYEWCHLIGHGDGGEEVPENYVAGTHYSNTEQLAMETAVRKFRGAGITLKVHAYVKPVRENISVDSYFGDYVRYTVMYGGKEIFSHLFSLHSNSFDRREWNILQVSCQEAIMEAINGNSKVSNKSKQSFQESHQKGLDKIEKESNSEPTNTLGQSNKLFESDEWGDLSDNAYYTSRDIRKEVDEVIKEQSEKKKQNEIQQISMIQESKSEEDEWSGFPSFDFSLLNSDPYFANPFFDDFTTNQDYGQHFLDSSPLWQDPISEFETEIPRKRKKFNPKPEEEIDLWNQQFDFNYQDFGLGFDFLSPQPNWGDLSLFNQQESEEVTMGNVEDEIQIESIDSDENKFDINQFFN